MKGFRQFIDEHFTAIVLVLLFLTVLAVFFHAMHDPKDASALNWLEHMDDQILAALLGFLTGYKVGVAAGTSKQAELPPAPPAAPAEQPKP
jgi:succinate dehydrogenase hydrophobic anchor subunit